MFITVPVYYWKGNSSNLLPSQRQPLVAKGHSTNTGMTLAKRDKSFPIW